MITPSEQAIIELTLTAHLASIPDDARGHFVATQSRDFNARLQYCKTPASYAAEALRVCIDSGWTHNPTWLERLINPIAILHGDLQALLANLPARRPPPTADPLQAMLLPNQNVVLDRASLRASLARLKIPNTMKPILIVDGPTAGGKSHALWLASHLCENDPERLCAIAGLQRGQEASTGAQELAKDLAFAIAGALQTPPQDTTATRYSLDLARWVVSLATSQAPQSVWIVLDGFHGPKLRDDTRAFIVDLADQITVQRVKRSGVRLILLGFDRTYLRVGSGFLETDIATRVQRTDVVAFVTALSPRCAQEVVVDAVVDAIWTGLPDDESFMPVLHARALRAAEAMLGEHAYE